MSHSHKLFFSEFSCNVFIAWTIGIRTPRPAIANMLTDHRVTAYIKKADAILGNATIIICAFKCDVLEQIIHFLSLFP